MNMHDLRPAQRALVWSLHESYEADLNRLVREVAILTDATDDSVLLDISWTIQTLAAVGAQPTKFELMRAARAAAAIWSEVERSLDHSAPERIRRPDYQVKYPTPEQSGRTGTLAELKAEWKRKYGRPIEREEQPKEKPDTRPKITRPFR